MLFHVIILHSNPVLTPVTNRDLSTIQHPCSAQPYTTNQKRLLLADNEAISY